MKYAKKYHVHGVPQKLRSNRYFLETLIDNFIRKFLYFHSISVNSVFL